MNNSNKTFGNTTVKTTFGNTTKTFTSIYTWVHHEARECTKEDMPAEMFAGYMQQWITLETLKSILSKDSYIRMACGKSNEELYDILSNHFMYCEEDSWEQAQDLEQWGYEDMSDYYLTRIV